MNYFLKKISPILVLAFFFSACTKDKDTTVVYPSFDEYVKGNIQLTMFARAIEKANLKDFTSGPGPFTWFAPTDAAFTAAGITVDSLGKLLPGTVSYLLMYHLVNARYTTIDMVAANSISRTTQLGIALFNGSFENSFYANGGKISSANNNVNNGVIHVTERLLTPPALRGNIQAILTNSGQHTLFIAALTRAGAWATLGTASIFTVMAPTDAAMNAAGLTAAAIAVAPIPALLAQMRYHYFLNIRLFTNDLASDVITIATAAGPSTSLTTSANGTKVRGKNNSTDINITTADRLGTNGVVHIIDGVLRP